MRGQILGTEPDGDLGRHGRRIVLHVGRAGDRAHRLGDPAGGDVEAVEVVAKDPDHQLGASSR